jgi:hypothetical protein
MVKKVYIWLFVAIALLAILFFMFGSSVSGFQSVKDFDGKMTIYKSGSCGCCGVYVNYFQRKGNSNVEIVNVENMNSIKKKYGIPSQLESCHTTIIGDYFVEGHVPLEAIEKLLEEKPNIKGIAMPGMPTGSPGMPGAKTGDFVIYAVENDGSYNEWTRL